jgi:transcriptional antiterminator NusG
LGESNESFLALTDDEVAWLNAFTNVETHVVEMSEGVIEGDRVLVTKGPLRGHEGLIAKVDRHKRLAELEIRMFGRDKRVRIGLEIVERKKSEQVHWI